MKIQTSNILACLRSIVFTALFILFFSVSSSAENYEKKFRKIIERFDVDDAVKELSSPAPSEFWKTARDLNERFLKFEKDIKKNHGAEKEALAGIYDLPKFYPEYNESVINEYTSYTDTLLMMSGIKEVSPETELYIVYSNTPDVFIAMKENGNFAICMTTGLLKRKGLNHKMVLGAVAHEFCHGYLKHHIRRFYAVAKKRRSERITSTIASTLNSIAAGMDAYNASDRGGNPNLEYYLYQANLIKRNEEFAVHEYDIEYLKDQIFEADLLAYRFSQTLGIEEDYINMLRLLGSDFDQEENQSPDSPTITQRINFLNFVKDNPHLGNTKDIKLRIHRWKREAAERKRNGLPSARQ